MQRRVLLGMLLGLCGVVIFGTTLPMTRLALGDLSPFFITFGRAALAGLLALTLLLIKGGPWPLANGRLLRDLAIVGSCVVFGFPLLMAVALQTVPAAHGGVVLGLLPLSTAFAAMLFAGERPGLPLFLASFVGAALIAVFTFRHGAAGAFGFGDGLLVLGVVACGIGYAVSGRLARTMPGWEVMALTLVVCLPFTLAGAVLTAPAAPDEVSLPAWGAFLYVGTFSQFFGFFFWNAGLAMGGIARVGQTLLLQPFVTVALAWPLNGEVPEAETLFFAAAMMVVVAFAQRSRMRDGAPEAATPPS